MLLVVVGLYSQLTIPPCCWQVIIWTTWVLIAGLIMLVMLSYNIFPDYQDQRTWCDLGLVVCHSTPLGGHVPAFPWSLGLRTKHLMTMSSPMPSGFPL